MLGGLIIWTMWNKDGPSPGGAERNPAGFTASRPVMLICAGSSTEANVFSFSSERELLVATPDGHGKVKVAGVARMHLRGDGDRSIFEGTVRVWGSGPADGSELRLEAIVDGDHWHLDLTRGGRGRLLRTRRHSGDRVETAYFTAHCQDAI